MTPLKVFILEDDGQRLGLFQEALKGCELTVSFSCADHEKFSPPYDIILLDHDLGMLFDNDPTVGDGNKFLFLIKDKLPLQSKFAMIIIHSWNKDAAQRMADTVKANGLNAILMPFGLTLLNLLSRLNDGV